MDSSQSFTVLHRKARKIEVQIDHRLVALSKIKNTDRDRVLPKYEEEPLLGEDDTSSKKNELEDLLSRFSAVLDELSDVAEQSQNGMQLRSVQQLRTAYDNDLDEFRKMCNSLVQVQGHANREPVPETRDSVGYSARRPKNDAALRENQSAHSSIQMVDEHIALALETREHLGSQRARFKSLQTRVNDIFSHFPRVGSLLQRIHSRKRLEAIILGVMIGLLTIASLAFMLS